MQKTNTTSTPLTLLAFVLVLCPVFAILVIIIGYVTGRGSLGNDAHFEEFHVCLHQERYEPIAIMPPGTRIFYLCGIIAGSGIQQSILHIYSDDHLLLSRYFEHFPGTFFERIVFDDELTVGVYEVQMYAEKHILTETEFTVLAEGDIR